MQAGQLFAALQSSIAVQTGFLKSLEECALMVDGVARDKLSDLTTNLIRQHLAEYTREENTLFDSATRSAAIPRSRICRSKRPSWSPLKSSAPNRT